MAITDETIGRIRSAASKIPQLAKNLKSTSEEVKSTLKSNGNYQYFRLGTDKGTAVDTSINDTVDTMIDRLIPSINSVVGQIESFCATQAELNRLERMKKGEETTGDILAGLGSK